MKPIAIPLLALGFCALAPGQKKPLGMVGEWHLDPARTSKPYRIAMIGYEKYFRLTIRPDGTYSGGMLGSGRWMDRKGTLVLSPGTSFTSRAELSETFPMNASGTISLERRAYRGIDELILRSLPGKSGKRAVRTYVRGHVVPPREGISEIEWLFIAVADGDATHVASAIAKRVSPNAYHPALLRLDRIRLTPLSVAIRRRNMDVARLLLKAGADPNLPSHLNLEPPIMTAARLKSVPLIRLLRAYGAQPSKKDATGKSAIDVAAKVGDPKTIAALKQP